MHDETRAANAQDVTPDTVVQSVPDTGAAAPTTTQTTDTAKTPDSSAVVQATPETPKKPVDPTAPYKDVEFAPGEKPRVVIETAFGKIVLELYPDVAKKHCQSFVYQINEGFYDSLTFHRVVLGFLIQAGDPLGTGTGGPGYTVPAEFTTKHIHEEGTLSMARRVDPASKTGAAEKGEFLNSAGSQFFICTARAASLDGKYTIFGKVVEGLDVIHSIEKTVVQRERPVAPIYMTRVYVEPKA
jgi:cyclophilin family peptidyl-prolyl cis-trans isomerase